MKKTIASPMNTKLLLIISIIAFASLRSTALAVDNRFDGIWVGTETVKVYDWRGQQHSEQQFERKNSAKIVIAQAGTLLGVLEGWGPGRYNDVRPVGNTIVFHAGVRTGQLSLSPDGQTLIEKGRIPNFFESGLNREGALSGNHPIVQSDKSTVEVTGTFHRQK